MESNGRAVSKVLLVDDVEMVLKMWARECRRIGKVPLLAKNLGDAIEMARLNNPEMAVVDLMMPNCPGFDVIRELKRTVELFAILVSAAMCTEYAMQGVRAGADDCCDKAVTLTQMVHRVECGKRPDPSSIAIPTLDEVERQHVVRVLSDCDGNVTHAAEALGAHRYTLQRRLAKWGILPSTRVRRSFARSIAVS